MNVRFIPILFILTTLLTACNIGGNPKEHLEEIYNIALESLMETDKALNSNMEFIAIDMSNFEEVNEKEKKVILNYFEDKYKV